MTVTGSPTCSAVRASWTVIRTSLAYIGAVVPPSKLQVVARAPASTRSEHATSWTLVTSCDGFSSSLPPAMIALPLDSLSKTAMGCGPEPGV